MHIGFLFHLFDHHFPRTHRAEALRGGAPIGAGGHDPLLFEAKGDRGTKLTLKTQR